MADYGTPIGVDQILRLSGMAHAYTNERMGRANALRGLTGLRSVSAPHTGIDESLRGLSTARDDEITNAIFADIVAETTPSVVEGGEALPVITQEQFERVFRKKYPQYVDRYLSDTLKLWSSYRGQEQKEQQYTAEVNKRSAVRMATRDFDALQKEWDASDQTNDTFNKLVTKYISKTSQPGRDPAGVAHLKSLINAAYGTRSERASVEKVGKEEELEANTQEFVDLVQSLRLGGYGESAEGLSNEAAWNNALIEFGGRPINEEKAVKLLGYAGIDILPPTTKHMFDTVTGQPVNLSERDLRGAETGRYIQGADAGGKMTVPWMEAGMALLYPKPPEEGKEATKPQITEEQFWHYYNNLFRAGKGGGIRPGEEALIGLWFNKVLSMQETKAKTLGDILSGSNI